MHLLLLHVSIDFCICGMVNGEFEQVNTNVEIQNINFFLFCFSLQIPIGFSTFSGNC